MKRAYLMGSIVFAILAAPTAFAQTHDHSAHAAAAAQADPRPHANSASLDKIIEDAQRRHPGRVIDVSYDDGKYDIDIQSTDGRIVEFEYSARTGRLIEVDHD